MKSQFNWKSSIQIDVKWVNRVFNFHGEEKKPKIKARVYTLKASGTTLSTSVLVEELNQMLPEYVFNADQIKKYGQRKSMSLAQKYFGKKDPKTDGKYGELLLFALVESVLECKMVAHKIRSLSNLKDQVKGGDGIFIGNYLLSDGSIEPAYLIGESKIMGSNSAAFNDAFESINRFHDKEHSAEFQSTELIVAKENMIVDSNVDIDELYDRLTPSTEIFQSQILIHPILLMFNSDRIIEAEKKSASAKKLEENIKEIIINSKSRLMKSIESRVAKYSNVQKVYLDFFIIPFTDVDSFRNAMYYEIHGVPHK